MLSSNNNETEPIPFWETVFFFHLGTKISCLIRVNEGWWGVFPSCLVVSKGEPCGDRERLFFLGMGGGQTAGPKGQEDEEQLDTPFLPGRSPQPLQASRFLAFGA